MSRTNNSNQILVSAAHVCMLVYTAIVVSGKNRSMKRFPWRR